MAEINSHDSTPDLQSFSATGRAYRPPNASRDGWSMNSLCATESFGAGPANLLPVRYDDNSLISVPVLRPNDIAHFQPEKAKKSLFSSRRKSRNGKFVVKQVSRREYLKHYAKDDKGAYCGTELPAEDCILRGDDLAKYRAPALKFEHEIVAAGTARKDDEVIR